MLTLFTLPNNDKRQSPSQESSQQDKSWPQSKYTGYLKTSVAIHLSCCWRPQCHVWRPKCQVWRSKCQVLRPQRQMWRHNSKFFRTKVNLTSISPLIFAALAICAVCPHLDRALIRDVLRSVYQLRILSIQGNSNLTHSITIKLIITIYY